MAKLSSINKNERRKQLVQEICRRKYCEAEGDGERQERSTRASA